MFYTTSSKKSVSYEALLALGFGTFVRFQKMAYTRDSLFYGAVLGSGVGFFIGCIKGFNRLNKDNIGIKNVALSISYPIIGAFVGTKIGMTGLPFILRSTTTVGMITILPVLVFFDFDQELLDLEFEIELNKYK